MRGLLSKLSQWLTAESKGRTPIRQRLHWHRRSPLWVEALETRSLLSANVFLQGTAFVDSNANGNLDTGESYLPGATITLYSASDTNHLNPLAHTTTNANGSYLFNDANVAGGLAPGNYQLVETPAAGYANAGTQVLSQLNPATGLNASTIQVTAIDPSNLVAKFDYNTVLSRHKYEFYQVTFFGDTFVDTVAQIAPVTVSPNGGPATPFFSFCTDFSEELNAGPNSFGVAPGPDVVGSGAPHNWGRIAYLYNHYGTGDMARADAVGLQLAIWELEYDNVPDFNSGNFKNLVVQNFGGFDTTTSADLTAALSRANFYISDSAGKSEDATFLQALGTGAGRQSVIATGSLNFANVAAPPSSGPPVITGTPTACEDTTDKQSIKPFPNVTISDPNPSQTLTITVFIENNSSVLFVGQSGTLDPQSAANNNFSVVGDPANRTFEFTGTAAQATMALRGLVFVPTENQVPPGQEVDTNFWLFADDGTTTVMNNQTMVCALSINDPPTISGTVANQATGDNTPIAPFTSASINDPDVQPVTVTITLSNPANGVFSATSLAGSGFSLVSPGVYRAMNSNAAFVTAHLRQLVFVPTNNQVTPANQVTTTFTVAVNDGIAPTATDNNTSVVVTSINDAPTITGTTNSMTVNDNQVAGVKPFGTVTIADVDAGPQTQTILVTPSDSANGSFTPASLGASGFVNLGNGSFQFIGTAAQATTAIRQLIFVPTNNQVAAGLSVTTTFTISAFDGFATTLNGNTTLTAKSIDDAATITGTLGNQAVNDNAKIKPFSNVTFTDVDSPSITVTISQVLVNNGSFNPASLGGFATISNGVYSFTGSPADATATIRLLCFVPTQNQVAPGQKVTTSFTLKVTDSFMTTTNTTTSVLATSVNDAPTIAGTVANQNVNDNATIQPFTGVTFADPDIGQSLTVTVKLSSAANGTFTNLGGFSALGGGQYRFAGSAATAANAIHGLVFVPTKNQLAPGLIQTTTFTIGASDGVATTTDNTTSVLALSINDPPTITGLSAKSISSASTVQPFSAATISDVDTPAQMQQIIITLSNAANGTFSAASLASSGFIALGGGQYKFTGTDAQATTAIRLLSFVPTAGLVAHGQTVTTGFSISIFDGIDTTLANTSVSVAY